MRNMMPLTANHVMNGQRKNAPIQNASIAKIEQRNLREINE
jgi:hypothetical protein